MTDVFDFAEGLITASDLVRWTEGWKRKSEGRFPELVRRLLDATPEAVDIEIRTGDSVVLGGYDGVAVLKADHKVLPAGKLVFEFGTNRDVKRKAAADYENRRLQASTELTFVFATPRRWQGKNEWAAERKADGVFRDVRVLDADDLEHWLQLAPAVQLWFGNLIGRKLQDAELLSAWWTEYRRSTKPELPQSLFAAGRASETQELINLLESDPTYVIIESTSGGDILGFLASALGNSEERFLPDPVIVKSDLLWKHFCSISGSGILIPDFENPSVQMAIASGKHVVLPMDYRKDRLGVPAIRLPRVARREVAEALMSAGVRSDEAEKLALLARRNLAALKRRINISPTNRMLVWTDPASSKVLSQLLVAGRWRDVPGDLEILQELTGLDDVEIEEQLLIFHNSADPVIWNSGDFWSFVSIEEAFLELSTRISANAQEKWCHVAVLVLAEPDPQEGLDQLQKIMNTTPRRKYSGELRRGIAEGLAVAASFCENGCGGRVNAEIPSRVVAEVLRRVEDPGVNTSWLSILSILPLLAESGPEPFLRILERDLAKEKPAIEELFEEERNPFGLGPKVSYPALLSAIETLSWRPEYLVSAVRILAKLSGYPVPRNYLNTPLSSLESILCGWLPRKHLDNAIRGEMLDVCFGISPTVGRELLKRLWPTSRSKVLSPYLPRFRDWVSEARPLTYGELAEFVDLLATKAISWANDDPSLLVWFVEAIGTSRSFDASVKLIDHLVYLVNAGTLSSSIRLDLLASACKTVAKHKKYESSSWAMPFEMRERLRGLCDLLDPSGTYVSAFSIFHRGIYLEGADRTRRANRANLVKKQKEAVWRILCQSNGWEALADVVCHVENPGSVGRAIALCTDDSALNVLSSWFVSDCEGLRAASQVWARSWLASCSPESLRIALEHESLSGQARKLFIQCIPPRRSFWRVLKEHPEDYTLYWQQCQFDVVEPEGLHDAVEELSALGRVNTVVTILARELDLSGPDGKSQANATVVISALQSVITSKVEDPQGLDPYDVDVTLDYLERVPVEEDVLASLEFAFCSSESVGHEPRALNRKIAADPDMFVELIRHAYRGGTEGESAETISQSTSAAAWRILHDWRGCPGLCDDGEIEFAELRRWVFEARQKLRDLNIANLGDELIGRIFVNAPKGNDGIWPAEPIRDLLESLSNEHLETGMILGLMNSQGSTTRGIYEGGAQEYERAAYYLEAANSVEAKWPRSASVLRKIGRLYEIEAAREDEEAEVAQDFG